MDNETNQPPATRRTDTNASPNIAIPISLPSQPPQEEVPPSQTGPNADCGLHPATSTTPGNEMRAMEQETHTRADELSAQLDELQSELSRAERSVDILRRARGVIYAEITREKHGIAPGDLVSWEGEQRGRNSQRWRTLTLRGVVVAVPMRDRLQIHRLNRHGKPMDQTVYVPVDCVELTAGQ